MLELAAWEIKLSTQRLRTEQCKRLHSALLLCLQSSHFGDVSLPSLDVSDLLQCFAELIINVGWNPVWHQGSGQRHCFSPVRTIPWVLATAQNHCLTQNLLCRQVSFIPWHKWPGKPFSNKAFLYGNEEMSQQKERIKGEKNPKVIPWLSTQINASKLLH